MSSRHSEIWEDHVFDSRWSRVPLWGSPLTSANGEYIMVTQTTEENIEYASVPTIQNETCDGGISDVYGVREVAYKRSISNDVDRRVKPDGYAWKNMTAQPPQYTEQSRSKIEAVEGSKFIWCPGFGMKKVASWTRSHYREQAFFGSVEDPRWETEMRLKIKDLSVNIGATLAEYKATASVFGDMVGGIQDAYKFLRNKRKKLKRLSFCDAASTELGISFGVNPLMQDTYDSIQALKRVLTRPIVRRFYLRKEKADSGIYVPNNTEGSVLWNDKVGLRVTVYVEFIPEGPSDITLGNPAELLWEVTPFSFVVDWAIPIGDWLSSLDALKDVKALNGCVTRKRTYNHVNRSIPISDPWNKYTLVKPGTRDYESHARTTMTTIPIEPLPTYSPSDSFYSLMHATSLLKVMSQGCRQG